MSYYEGSKTIKEESKMPNQLRRGIRQLKQFYINKLLKSGIYTSDDDLDSLTLSELELILKKAFPSNK